MEFSFIDTQCDDAVNSAHINYWPCKAPELKIDVLLNQVRYQSHTFKK
jgi:hypothetical protein